MPLQLMAPIVKEFHLKKSDETYHNDGDPTLITVREATNGDEIKRNQKFALVKQEISADKTISYSSSVSIDNVHEEEVYLTLAGCNLTEDGQKMLFTFKEEKGVSRILMSRDAFAKAWGTLPYQVAKEIVDYVHEQNPQWGSEGNE